MRRRLLLTSVGAIGAAMLAATALAALPANTFLTIKGPQGDFQGTITSPKLQKCANNRTVNVYKQKSTTQRPRSDTKIGADTSQVRGSKGQWSIGNSGFKSGRFYARAPAKPGCKVGISKTIRVISS